MIIKPDYIIKQKILLRHLLQQGFFIKGQRKTVFTPEFAAEFYNDRIEDDNFMFRVIQLSKGKSEAFILAKEHAVNELVDVMVCYFGSLFEMEERIHVTQFLNKVQREISFIFPNYIHEPILFPEQNEFCSKNSLIETTVNTLYDIVTNLEKEAPKTWKEKLCESLISTNRALPYITNQCSYNLDINKQDNSQQTDITWLNAETRGETYFGKTLSSDFSNDCSSINFTTSTCVSCSGFDSGAVSLQQPLEETMTECTMSLEVPSQSSASSLNEEREEFYAEELVEIEESCNNLAELDKDQDIFKMNSFKQIDILIETENSLKINDPFDELIKSKVPNSDNNSSNLTNEQNISIDKNSTHSANVKYIVSFENVFSGDVGNEEINFVEQAEEE